MKNKFRYDRCRRISSALLPGIICLFLASGTRVFSQTTLAVDWTKTVSVSKTSPTLQVVVNPLLRTNSSIHDGTFAALKNMGADYVRYVPWFPYPRMVVAELEPPTKDSTFWSFAEMDTMMKDFMEATKGHSVVINFSTIPVWMFKTDKRVDYPADPNEVFWAYNAGTELRDSTLKELADYYVRVFSWYIKGGFTDEHGKFHKSGYFYKIPYWEVLNEPDLEHATTPKQYVQRYDAIVLALKKISPETKFIGISVAYNNNPEFFEYFLNKANHKKGVPLEGISYHFYGIGATTAQDMNLYQYTFFDQATGFLEKVRYIESIRKRLAPQVFTTVNEIGSILKDEQTEIDPGYWPLSGALYAHIFVELTKLGIDVAGESQLVGYPTQFPEVSMMNWKNAKPNARYWVLKLLHDDFGPGDKLVDTKVTGPSNSDLSNQAFITPKGKKILLINKTIKEMKLDLPAETVGAKMKTVDTGTGDSEASEATLSDSSVTLKPFSVNVVSLGR